MEQTLAQALEEYLQSMEQDRATVNDFLVRYPQHAVVLRSLEATADRVRGLPSPTSTHDGFAVGKRRMLEALEEKSRQSVPLTEPLPLPAARTSRFAEGIQRLIGGIRAALLRLTSGAWMTRLIERHRGSVAWARAATVRLSPKAWVTRLVEGIRQVGAQSRSLGLRLAPVAMLACVLLCSGGIIFQGWSGTRVVRAATVAYVAGEVQVRPAGGDEWVAARIGMQVAAGDTVRTESASLILLTFFDGSTTALGAETEIEVVHLSSLRSERGKVIVMRQRLGQTYNSVQPLVDSNSRFEIQTGAAVAEVRGTEFTLEVEPDGTTQVVVVKGQVDIVSDSVTVPVEAGHETVARPEQAPEPQRPAAVIPSPPVSAPDLPSEAESPGQPAYGETPGLPGKSGGSEPTKDPEATKKPKPTEEPEATKEPKPTEEPKPTKEPEPTEEPKPTKEPEPTKEPKPTEEPEPKEEPKPTKIPKDDSKKRLGDETAAVGGTGVAAASLAVPSLLLVAAVPRYIRPTERSTTDRPV